MQTTKQEDYASNLFSDTRSVETHVMDSESNEEYFDCENGGEPSAEPCVSTDNRQSCTVTLSNRGGLKLNYDGFQFYKDKQVCKHFILI